ncbi:MAG: sulfatase-like hydrolase/transferase, partial [Gammaproteobacteria bacterium]
FHVIGSIYETDPRETSEFLATPAVMALFALGIALFILSWLMLFRSGHRPCGRSVSIDLRLLMLGPFFVFGFALLLTQFGFRWTEAYPFNVAYKVYKYQTVVNQASLFRKNSDLNKPEVRGAIYDIKDPFTMLLVIGESERKHSLGLYGYERDTTPLLGNLAKYFAGTRFFAFADVLAAAPFTRVSVPSMLSMADIQSFSEIQNFPSVIQIFNAGGFKSFLASNQAFKGFENNLVGAFMADVKERTYLVENSKLDEYDENLIEVVERFLEDSAPRKFIIVHLAGSHMDYNSKYPEKHNYFKGRSLKDAYDNTIRYTDFVLGTLVRRLEFRKEPVSLVFCSDHGENLDDSRDGNYGHGLKPLTRYELQIPLIVWSNQQYERSHSTKLAQLAQHIDVPVGHDHISHTLLGLAGLYAAGYEAKNDISSPSFQRSMRHVIDRNNNLYSEKDLSDLWAE